MCRKGLLFSQVSLPPTESDKLNSRPCLQQIMLGMSVAMASTAFAGGVPTLDTVIEIDYDNTLMGAASSASEGTVSGEDLATRPLLRPAEVLEAVPGLIVSQHSGSGKANQYYLRGFNLDHGTDFATSLMSMPLNMPTHGHGQGYLDLQFLIPELIDRIQYRKGPLAADVGDFATAGSAAIDYVRTLDAPFVDLTIGEYGYRRGLVAGSSRTGEGTLLHALELTGSDGPWVLSEDLSKRNALLRYSQGSRDHGWSVSAMAYASSWNATDQVPQRALASGQVSRFGNLDPTDGGKTERYSLSYEWAQRGLNQQQRANAYLVDSSLNLWSNFTYCLNDIALNGNCNRGDQFEQVDRRQVYGGSVSQAWQMTWRGKPTELTVGLQGRFDDIGEVALNTSSQRQRTGTIRRDQVREGNLGVYIEQKTQWLDMFRSVVGLRGDAYRFDVNSDRAINSGQRNAQIASPKLALIFGPWRQTEYYLQASSGFHSNDARGVTSRVNPDFRDPANFLTATERADPLVRARSYELGLRTAIVPRLQTSLALWQLDLASELLFIGDAGTTEASAPSRRRGIELANYWTPTEHITVDVDAALSKARFRNSSPGGRLIPGSIEKTASVSTSWNGSGAWSGSARLRYFGPRPLIEDGSVKSKGSTLTNLQMTYAATQQLKLRLEVLNVFDRNVSDIDYFYESQLAGEAAPAEDIHTHPAEPRTVRAAIRWSF